MADMKIQLEDGKYELIYEDETCELFARRYGEYWQDYTGSKFMCNLLAKITELQQENENIRRANLDCMEHFDELMKDYKTSQYQLSSLLARIHRDGGHYEAENGTTEAIIDADLIVANLNAMFTMREVQKQIQANAKNEDWS